MSSQKRAVIDPEKCGHCHTCPPMDRCPAGAIEREDEFVYVSPACIGCQKCLENCIHQAMKMV